MNVGRFLNQRSRDHREGQNYHRKNDQDCGRGGEAGPPAHGFQQCPIELRKYYGSDNGPKNSAIEWLKDPSESYGDGEEQDNKTLILKFTHSIVSLSFLFSVLEYCGGVLHRSAPIAGLQATGGDQSTSWQRRAYVRVPATVFRPGFAISYLSKRGRRNAGCALHPRSACAKSVHIWRTRAYRQRKHSTSPRNGFTAYFVLSPVERACCHRHLRENSRKLGASIAAPGPHDLTVRSRTIRL